MYYYDTIGYAGIGEGLVGQLRPPETTQTPTVEEKTASANPGRSGAKVDATHSKVYGLIVGLFSLSGQLAWLAAAQAGLLVLTGALIARVTSRQAGLSSGRLDLICLPIITCGLSALPFYVIFLMPDILAALGILAAAAMVVYARQMRLPEILLAWCVATLAAMTHLSHLALLALLFPFAALMSWSLTPSRWWLSPALVGSAAAAGAMPIVALKIALTLLHSVAQPYAEMTVTVSDASQVTADPAMEETPEPTPLVFKPFLTARLIVDGPGLTFLQKRCPEVGLATCHLAQYFQDPDLRSTRSYVSLMIFSKAPDTGSYRLLPEHIQTQVAQEQLKFAALVLRNQPFGILAALLQNTYAQLITFSVDMTIPTDGIAAMMYRSSIAERNPLHLGRLSYDKAWLTPINWLHGAVYVLSTVGILWFLLAPGSAVPREMKVFGGMVLVGIVANALICGGLSEPASRYGARVIWLLPYLMVSMWVISRQRQAVAQDNSDRKLEQGDFNQQYGSREDPFIRPAQKR